MELNSLFISEGRMRDAGLSFTANICYEKLASSDPDNLDTPSGVATGSPPPGL